MPFAPMTGETRAEIGGRTRDRREAVVAEIGGIAVHADSGLTIRGVRPDAGLKGDGWTIRPYPSSTTAQSGATRPGGRA